MRFILVRATARVALEMTASMCAPLVAQLLHPGQPLPWTGLAPHSCFVVPLLPQEWEPQRAASALAAPSTSAA